jgi:hypothetical protein
MNLTLDNLKNYTTEEGDCWMWSLSLNNGYPQATVGKQPGVLVRRFIFCLGRELRPGWRVISYCGERRCVNPEHLTQASPGRVLKTAYEEGRRVESYAGQLSRRMVNAGLPKPLSEQERAYIDEHKGVISCERIAADISRSSSAVRGYAHGRTYRKAVANSSVFAWRP